jgi:hypothetical protein
MTNPSIRLAPITALLFALMPSGCGGLADGKLLDLGNGTVLGRLDRTPPSRKAGLTHGLGGYAGGYDTQGSMRGTYLLDLETKSGALCYGTENGLLMKLAPAATTKTSSIANLAAASAVSSRVRGYLAEVTTNVLAAVVYDYDASGSNVARRLVTVDVSTGATSTRDITAMVDEFEPYPGVLGLN